jgi:hypothetical protein
MKTTTASISASLSTPSNAPICVPAFPFRTTSFSCAGVRSFQKAGSAKLRGRGSIAQAMGPSPLPCSPWHETQRSL